MIRSKVITVISLLHLFFLPQFASAYIMSELSYDKLFERADVVVIASPVTTRESKIKLAVGQPKAVTNLIMTVDTEFKVEYVIKGKMEQKKFNFLHLARKDRRPAIIFGEVGTFFVDFEAQKMKNKSYILFLKKQGDGTYCTAWKPMEGSRAVISVPREAEL